MLKENYQISQTLRQSDDRYLLVWGTNPMLYAQSGKQPVGRFTVVFHIKDFKAEQETFEALKSKNPRYVVVMNDEADSFPELNNYLREKYIANPNFDHMVLWKRR